jgi:hypothetical protein
MPLDKLTCPKCRATLKPARPVPEGKTVKCPKCEELFKAGEEAGAAPKADAKPAKPAKPEAPAKKPDEEEEGGTYGVIKDEAEERKKADREEREERKKRKRRARDEGEDEDEDEDEKDEEEEEDAAEALLKTLKSKDPRGPAQEIIVRPANWLLGTAILGFFGWLLYFVVFMIPIAFPNRPDTDTAKGPPVPSDKGKYQLSDEMIQRINAAAQLSKNSQNKLNDVKTKKWDTRDDLYRTVIDSLDAAEAQKVKAVGPKILEGGSRDKYQHWWSAETILDEDNTPWSVILFIFVLILGVAQAGAVAYGAVKMQSLEAYQWSMAACIVAIVPLVTFPLFVFLTWALDLFDSALDAGWADITWIMALVAFLWGPIVGGLCLKQFLQPEVKAGYEYHPD